MSSSTFFLHDCIIFTLLLLLFSQFLQPLFLSLLPKCWYQLALISFPFNNVYQLFSSLYITSWFTSSFLFTSFFSLCLLHLFSVCLYQHNLAFLIIFSVYHLTFPSYLCNPFLFVSIDQGSSLDFSPIKNFMKYSFTQH